MIAPPRTAADTRALIEQLGEAATHLLLVGGQALNLWAEHYAKQSPAVLAEAPFTSKDVDFCASRADVVACAAKLGGSARFPPPEDATPSVGNITLVDSHGETWRIDFLERPFGLERDEVVADSEAFEIMANGVPTGLQFHVMNPVHCLISRACNVVGLWGAYDNPHGRKQLVVSLLVAREYLLERLAADDAAYARDLCERLARFCLKHRHGRDVAARTGVEPFDAVPCDARMGAAFVERRYPQLLAQVREVRRKALEARARADKLGR